MKRTFGFLIAVGVLMLSPAMADDHPHGAGGSHAAPHASSHGSGHGSGSSRAGASAHNEHRPAVRTVHTSRTVHVHSSHKAPVHRASVPHRTTTATRSHRTTTHNVRAASVHRHVTPAVAHRHVADVRTLRRNFTAPRRFQYGAYVRPHGWYAHRWSYGERLPGGWYARNYWIAGFAAFGLLSPPDGYQWVRVGDDAMLVDVDTGEIIRVEYGVFY